MLSEKYVNKAYSNTQRIVFDDRKIIEDNYEMMYDIMYLMRYDFGLDKIGLVSNLSYWIYATIESDVLYMGICGIHDGEVTTLTKIQVFSPASTSISPLYINGDEVFNFVSKQLKKFDNSHR